MELSLTLQDYRRLLHARYPFRPEDAFRNGQLVRRNPDSWIFGSQDSDANGQPVVGMICGQDRDSSEWFHVLWQTGHANIYKMIHLLPAAPPDLFPEEGV